MIGTVAALRPEKNLARLLRAFRLVADVMPARLVIAGDGPERPGLEQLTRDLGLSGLVRFTGHLDDPAALYRTLDIFALSSDTEQMPLSVIEAMASGLPVAATAVGDVAAMLAAENQAFVTPLEDAALAGRLRLWRGTRRCAPGGGGEPGEGGGGVRSCGDGGCLGRAVRCGGGEPSVRGRPFT